MSLRAKKVVFEKAFDEFRQDLEKMFNFTGLDQVSGMKMYQYPLNQATNLCFTFKEKIIALFLDGTNFI